MTHVFGVNDYTLSISRRDIRVGGPDRHIAEEIARAIVTMLATAEGQDLVAQFSGGYPPAPSRTTPWRYSIT